MRRGSRNFPIYKKGCVCFSFTKRTWTPWRRQGSGTICQADPLGKHLESWGKALPIPNPGLTHLDTAQPQGGRLSLGLPWGDRLAREPFICSFAASRTSLKSPSHHPAPAARCYGSRSPGGEEKAFGDLEVVQAAAETGCWTGRRWWLLPGARSHCLRGSQQSCTKSVRSLPLGPITTSPKVYIFTELHACEAAAEA